MKGAGLTTEERSLLGTAIADQWSDPAVAVTIMRVVVPAVERIVADRDAALDEARETIVTLRDGYREAVGVPPSEHQSRRLEAMATRIEELMAENANLRAALHPAPSDGTTA